MLRRTPLERSAPLVARTPLAARTPLVTRTALAAGSALTRSLRPSKPRRDTGPTKEARALVYARAGERCERCGTGQGPFNVHHRKPRGAGGTSDPAANSASNTVLICGMGGTDGCHGWVESNRREALKEGWLVPRTADPADCPVKVHGAGWVQLKADGTYDALTAQRND